MEIKTNHETPISVLFVEDDELILELQVSLLAAKYPDVVFYTAVNGRLGLELFKTHNPDIVITDINMPEMCGLEMSSAIRELNPGTLLIVITGNSNKLVQQNSDGKVVEFDHLIVKPVYLPELFSVVEQCIEAIKQQQVVS